MCLFSESRLSHGMRDSALALVYPSERITVLLAGLRELKQKINICVLCFVYCLIYLMFLIVSQVAINSAVSYHFLASSYYILICSNMSQPCLYYFLWFLSYFWLFHPCVFICSFLFSWLIVYLLFHYYLYLQFRFRYFFTLYF